MPKFENFDFFFSKSGANQAFSQKLARQIFRYGCLFKFSRLRLTFESILQYPLGFEKAAQNALFYSGFSWLRWILEKSTIFGQKWTSNQCHESVFMASRGVAKSVGTLQKWFWIILGQSEPFWRKSNFVDFWPSDSRKSL